MVVSAESTQRDNKKARTHPCLNIMEDALSDLVRCSPKPSERCNMKGVSECVPLWRRPKEGDGGHGGWGWRWLKASQLLR